MRLPQIKNHHLVAPVRLSYAKCVATARRQHALYRTGRRWVITAYCRDREAWVETFTGGYWEARRNFSDRMVAAALQLRGWTNDDATEAVEDDRGHSACGTIRDRVERHDALLTQARRDTLRKMTPVRLAEILRADVEPTVTVY
jgi:hypothetical protein